MIDIVAHQVTIVPCGVCLCQYLCMRFANLQARLTVCAWIQLPSSSGSCLFSP